MKTAILSLIKDDIRFTAISKTLSSIGWETENLTTNNLSVICFLLQIGLTDPVADWYYRILENNTSMESPALAEAIFEWLSDMKLADNSEGNAFPA